MARNLKVLGFVLAAAFATSGMVASVTTAAQFTAVNGAAQHLVMSDTGAGDALTVGGSEITCSEESYTANLPAGASETVHMTPNNIKCKTGPFAFNNVTVTHNGCTITLRSNGTWYMTCPSLKAIEYHHFSLEAHSSSTCTNTVGEQVGVGSVTYTNNADGSVTVSGTLTTNLQTHGSCSFGFTLNQESTYHLSGTIKATSGTAIHVK